MDVPKFNQGEIAITVNTKFGENWGKVVELKNNLEDDIGQSQKNLNIYGWWSASVIKATFTIYIQRGAIYSAPIMVNYQNPF